MLSPISQIIRIFAQETKNYPPPMSFLIVQKYGDNPFFILVSCLLSLRARDTMTYPISCMLFDHYATPTALAQAHPHEIEKIIQPIGFFKTKTQVIQRVAAYLIEHHQGMVPRTFQELIAIPGVGPKTAHLVLSVAYHQPAICVDIHVHRISNRMGLITTRTPEETETALKRIVPISYWSAWNAWLVVWGQHICTPQSPRCSICPLNQHCAARGVIKKR